MGWITVLAPRRVMQGARAPGTLDGMGDEPTASVSGDDEDMRPCDFCGHLVAADSVDEYDCSVCGDPESR
ncbi:hypothetical protein GCM10022207_82280 [Streptomyces lannensis]|uniref:Small CPxCG-related zinc finger protein n=1 Tax=Streptomyces lannensis TaxID=766498 RepID=A0ABP7LJY3_9ACTN